MPAFSNKVVNFNAQTISSAEMAEAAAKGLQYEFQNSKNNALLAATMAAYRTNTIKGFVSAIRDMGQDYTAEAFQKEFNIDIADTNYNTPQEYAEKVASDLQKYTNIIEDMKRGVKNKLVDPQAYQEGTIDRTIANHTRAAQEEAISIIAMNAIKADMTAERLKGVTADLSAIPGLSMSSDYAMRVLSNPSFLSNEIDTVMSQIKQLNTTLEEGNLTGDVKKQTEKQLKELITTIVKNCNGKPIILPTIFPAPILVLNDTSFSIMSSNNFFKLISSFGKFSNIIPIPTFAVVELVGKNQ